VSRRPDGTVGARRRRVPVAALIALLAGAGACTGSPGDQQTSPGSGTAARSAAGPTPDCGELCVSPEPVRIGATVPLSGPLAAYGRAQRAGMERAVAAATDDDGQLQVGGLRRPVELDVRDDQGDADVAAQWLLQLVRRRHPVTALLGPCSASAVEVRLAEAREVPLLSGCARGALAGVPEGRAWSWQVGPTEAERATAVLTALRTAGPVALLVTPGHDVAPYRAAAVAAGVRLLGPWEPGDDGWRSAARAAAAAGARGVLALTEPPAGRSLWPALTAAGLRPVAAYASEAALPGWPGVDLPDGVLTDATGPLPAAPEAAVEAGAAEATAAVLAAVRSAGNDRPQDLRAALAEADLRRPYRLARRVGDRLVPP